MKIEKINENQIRCTLTREDLEHHQIRLSELAYGTDKAKQLFRDMMQQAQIQFGFEADNIPLMIEAIPISTEAIILQITKVEDPEELDTRFSKFAPFRGEQKTEALQFDGADNILDLFQKLRDAAKSHTRRQETDKNETIAETQSAEEGEPVSLIRLFSFRSLDDVIGAAHGLNGFFQGQNNLYAGREGDYRLVLHQGNHSPEDFNRICNILSEYGSGKAFTSAGEAYLQEHESMLSEDALNVLAKL